MANPRISVIVYTARTGYPYIDAPDIEPFAPTIETLATQTFTDFEVVVVDAHYPEREGWFKDHPQPYPVKYVEGRGSYWHKLGRPALCADLNGGIAHCRGDIILPLAAEVILPTHALATVDRLAAAGSIPVFWYAVATPVLGNVTTNRPVLDFSWRGYNDGTICAVEHRGERFYNPSVVASAILWGDVYQWTAWPRDVLMAVNGYDEAFDGDFGLFDVDLASRVEMAWHGNRFMLHRDLWCVRARCGTTPWSPTLARNTEAIKCCYGLLTWNRIHRRHFANVPHASNLPILAKDVLCSSAHGICPLKGRCSINPKSEEGQVHPFCDGKDAALLAKWFEYIFDPSKAIVLASEPGR